ncbi:25885_t:CDS:1, partial [Gigaspora rosea]
KNVPISYPKLVDIKMNNPDLAKKTTWVSIIYCRKVLNFALVPTNIYYCGIQPHDPNSMLLLQGILGMGFGWLRSVTSGQSVVVDYC